MSIESNAGRAAVYAGHIFRGADMDAAAQAEEEARLAPMIAALYGAEDIRSVHGALAAGSDILFAEAALATGIPLHVVLPFDADAFAVSSVALGNPPDAPGRWDARYRAALAAATSVRLSSPQASGWQRDAWYRTAFREAAAAGLFAADRRGTECLMLAITDQGGSPSPGGTTSATANWTERGRRLLTLPFTGKRRTGAAAARHPSPVLPVLVLRPADDEGRARLAAVRPALGETRPSIGLAHDGLALLFDLAADTLSAARLAADPSLRVVCDFGLVCEESGAPDPAAIASLPGAGDLVGTLAGTVLATEAFAREARFESDALARVFAADAFFSSERFTPLNLFGM